MLGGVVTDLFVVAGFVGGDPEHFRRIEFACVLRHLCGKDSHRWVRVGQAGTAGKGVGGFGIVLELCVVDKSQVLIKVPVVGIVLDTVVHQFDGAVGLA